MPQTWDGVPHQTWDGVPPWTWDGVPPRHGTGYPQTWDGVPPRHGMQYPLPDMGWGTPSPPETDQHSEHLLRGGGIPLAFTQEDFLVYLQFSDNNTAQTRWHQRMFWHKRWFNSNCIGKKRYLKLMFSLDWNWRPRCFIQMLTLSTHSTMVKVLWLFLGVFWCS